MKLKIGKGKLAATRAQAIAKIKYIKQNNGKNCGTCSKEINWTKIWNADHIKVLNIASRIKCEPQTTHKQYCSKTCFKKRAQVKVKCNFCSKIIIRKKGAIDKNQTVFFCDRKCSENFNGTKKKNNICSRKGCNKIACKKTVKKNGQDRIRLCSSHYIKYQSKAQKNNKGLSNQAYQRSYNIVSVVNPLISLKALREQTARYEYIKILEMAGIKVTNEFNFNGTGNNPRVKTLDIDIVIPSLELVIEHKNTHITTRKKIVLKQNKEQKKAIEKSEMKNYKLEIISVDGSVGKYNWKTGLQFIKNRVLLLDRRRKLKGMNINHAISVLDFYINLFENKCSNQFIQPKIQLY